VTADGAATGVSVLTDMGALRARLDRALSDRPRRALDRSDLISAAVLVPIVDHDGVPHLLFTKKSAAVPHHKGQFSFPGGIVEERDGSRVETALRVAWEEIQLPATAVEVLGLLDDTETRATPFVITPVVGVVSGHVVFVPDGREIERVIEVPLATVADPAIFRTEIWERGGEPHPVHFYQVSVEDVVWGATARIVKQFLEVVADTPTAG
jgi:8-oxo-dGTP pyrophosphatase MutT (NUDIX family)